MKRKNRIGALVLVFCLSVGLCINPNYALAVDQEGIQENIQQDVEEEVGEELPQEVEEEIQQEEQENTQEKVQQDNIFEVSNYDEFYI